VICHCAGFHCSFLLPPCGRVSEGGISIPIALHWVISTYFARIKPSTASPTALSVRFGLGGSGTGNPIEAMALSVACSLIHCQQDSLLLSRCNARARLLEAHPAHEKEEVPLLQRQAIAESRLSRKLCLEVSDLRGKIPRLRFESCSLLFQCELRATVARQLRRFCRYRVRPTCHTWVPRAIAPGFDM
jgi:hypothetical protein